MKKSDYTPEFIFCKEVGVDTQDFDQIGNESFVQYDADLANKINDYFQHCPSPNQDFYQGALKKTRNEPKMNFKKFS